MENPPKIKIIEIRPSDYTGQAYEDIQDCPLYRAAKRAGFDVGNVGPDSIVVRSDFGYFTRRLRLNQSFNLCDYRAVVAGQTVFRTVILPEEAENEKREVTNNVDSRSGEIIECTSTKALAV